MWSKQFWISALICSFVILPSGSPASACSCAFPESVKTEYQAQYYRANPEEHKRLRLKYADLVAVGKIHKMYKEKTKSDSTTFSYFGFAVKTMVKGELKSKSIVISTISGCCQCGVEGTLKSSLESGKEIAIELIPSGEHDGKNDYFAYSCGFVDRKPDLQSLYADLKIIADEESRAETPLDNRDLR